MPLCRGTTKRGYPCRFHAGPSGYCHVHGPPRVPTLRRTDDPLVVRVELRNTASRLSDLPQSVASGQYDEDQWAIWLFAIGTFLFILLFWYLSNVGGGGHGSGSVGQCRSGQPCGASCISWEKECRQ